MLTEVCASDERRRSQSWRFQNKLLSFSVAPHGYRAELRCVDLEDRNYVELLQVDVVGWALVRRVYPGESVNEIEPVLLVDGYPINLTEYRRMHDAQRVSCFVGPA